MLPINVFVRNNSYNSIFLLINGGKKPKKFNSCFSLYANTSRICRYYIKKLDVKRNVFNFSTQIGHIVPRPEVVDSRLLQLLASKLIVQRACRGTKFRFLEDYDTKRVISVALIIFNKSFSRT